MFDCANVEMRELLPDFVSGSVDAATRARVEEHIATCAECASEVETLRLVRSAFAATPAIDIQRVVAALPKPAAATRAGGGRAPVKRWMDWRIAAALTMISVGGLSLAIGKRLSTSPRVGPDDTVTIVQRVDSQSVPVAPPQVTPTPTRIGGGKDTVRPTPPRPAIPAKAMLSAGGGVSDLDEESLRALLGALDEIDRAPLAPSAEPDRSPVLPVIKEDER
jgi:hypothetical protein